jgi:hypothetical protein
LTWSAPVIVDDVGRSSTGGLQRISWVSFAQPADRYLDNTARFFLGYYRIDDPDGMSYRNRLRWLRVQVGPRADFDGDGEADANDEEAFQAAFDAGESRADFNDDGVVDDQDASDFADALAGEESATGWVSATSLAFGNRMLNVASPGQAVTVTNTSAVTLPVRSASVSGADAVEFSHRNNCPRQLAAGERCTVTVRFRPTSTGNKSANLVIELGDDAGERTVALSGIGVDYSFTVSRAILEFGEVPSGTLSVRKNVTVRNTSSVSLPLPPASLEGNHPAQFARTSNCPGQLAAGASCNIIVRFRPTSTGEKTARLVIAPGNGVAAKTVELSGTGT